MRGRPRPTEATLRRASCRTTPDGSACAPADHPTRACTIEILDRLEGRAMSSLFIVGNTNVHTFANAALASHIRDQDRGGPGITDALVLHSPESEQHLFRQSEWKHHLSSHGLHPEAFVNCTIDLHKGGDERLVRAARHIERFFVSLD